MNTRAMTDKARSVTDKVQDFQKKATESVKTAGTATDQYIRDNTWASIGIAAALGCIVGFFLVNRD
jgi:ElaB/YqjD/DUF883 family membrane-anchored ribosome-binding protein